MFINNPDLLFPMKKTLVALATSMALSACISVPQRPTEDLSTMQKSYPLVLNPGQTYTTHTPENITIIANNANERTVYWGKTKCGKSFTLRLQSQIHLGNQSRGGGQDVYLVPSYPLQRCEGINRIVFTEGSSIFRTWEEFLSWKKTLYDHSNTSSYSNGILAKVDRSRYVNSGDDVLHVEIRRIYLTK